MNLQSLSDRQIAALVRIAKTRGRAFFAHPKAMIELRNEHQRRVAQNDPDKHQGTAGGQILHRDRL